MLEKNRELWPDDKLLEMLRHGDHGAFKQIYNIYSSKLYLSAYNVLRNKQAAEDVIQEVMVKLWTDRTHLKIDSLGAFLYTAVRHRVFTVIRSGNVRTKWVNQTAHVAIHNETEETIAERDLNRLLDKNVANLPEKCREIFLLSRKDQLSNKEIAARLGISTKTVENQLTIAIRKLRRHMGNLLIWIFCLLGVGIHLLYI